MSISTRMAMPSSKRGAAEFTPEYVEKVTGVKAADIAKFAKEFATAQPSVIRLGVALERTAGGGQAIRAVCSLPALVGSWKHVGGGLLQMPLWDFPVDWMKVSRGDWIKPGTRVVNNLQLGRALTGEMKLDPPIKSLFVYCTNPVSQAPETNKIVKGLQREDLFTVVAEHFLTDTAKYADIVLPAAMAGEAEDMMWSWGHFYFTYNQKAIDPPGECLPTSEMWRRLAKEMGFDDPIFKMTDSELAAYYINWDDPKMAGVDMEYFKQHGYFKIDVGSADTRTPHKDGKFPTPSGKVEFLLHDAKNFVAGPFRMMYDGDQCGEAVDPLPGYVPMRESPETNPAQAKLYTLNIISPKSHGFLNSCYANEPHKIKGQGDQFVLISPADAAKRSIREGDPVRVFNGRGDFEGVARVTDDVNPGIVVATLGYWRSLNRSDGSVNSISSDAHSGLGRAPTFSDNLVEVDARQLTHRGRSLLFGGDARRAVGLHLLQDGEALEFGVAEIKRLVGAGAAMRLAEGLGPRPVPELRLRAPDGMGGVEHMVVALRTFQQMKDDESRHLVQMRLARQPDLLEVVLRTLLHFEPVHRNEHDALLR